MTFNGTFEQINISEMNQSFAMPGTGSNVQGVDDESPGRDAIDNDELDINGNILDKLYIDDQINPSTGSDKKMAQQKKIIVGKQQVIKMSQIQKKDSSGGLLNDSRNFGGVKGSQN